MVATIARVMRRDEILLAPLETSPAYEAVVDRVRRALALGVLLPGDRLPSERTLAEELGVSRVTVREALRILQGEGILITRRGSGGTVVSDTIHTAGGLSVDLQRDVTDVFEFRVAVEGLAARKAAERSAGEVVELLECQQALAVSRSIDEFRRADSHFHLMVARMSENPMLRNAIEDARAAAFAWLDLREFTVFHESSIAGHAAVIDAIANGDPNAAAAAMTNHIETAQEEVLRALRSH